MNLYDLIVAKKLSGGGGGGGGGSSYTLIHEQDLEVTYSSSSAKSAVSIPLDSSDVFTNDCIVYVRIRDKAGKRNGYWYGSDNYVYFKNFIIFGLFYSVDANGNFEESAAKDPGSYGSGLYLREIKSSGIVQIYKKYSSGTIDGTYHIEVYKLDWPGGVSPAN